MSMYLKDVSEIVVRWITECPINEYTVEKLLPDLSIWETVKKFFKNLFQSLVAIQCLHLF